MSTSAYAGAPEEAPDIEAVGCGAWSERPETLEPAPYECLQSLQRSVDATSRILLQDDRQHVVTESHVVRFEGVRGQRSHPTFKVEPEWVVRWRHTGEWFRLFLHESESMSSDAPSLVRMDTPGEGEYESPEGGTYYLETDAGGAWELDVVQRISEPRYSYDLTLDFRFYNPFDHAIEVSFDYDDGRLKTLVLQPGGHRHEQHAQSLRDFHSPRSEAQLLGEVSVPVLRQIRSAAPEARAEIARLEKQEAARLAEIDLQHAQLRAESEKASIQTGVELKRSRAVRHRRQVQRERAREQRARALDSTERRRKSLVHVLSGTAVLSAGLLGGASLLTIGSLERPNAQEALDEFKQGASTHPETNEKLVESELVRRLRTAKTQQAIGASLATASVAVSAVFYVMAARHNRLDREQNLSRVWAPSPWWGPRGGGVSWGGRF